MIKKIITIMWHDKFVNPFRILTKSYARYRKGGFINFKNGLNREYYSIIKNIKFSYKYWIEKNESNIFTTSKQDYEPVISIILICRSKTLLHLQDTLESIMSQTYNKWEVFAVCDLLGDQSIKEFLSQYENKYPNIHIVYMDDKFKMGEKINFAIKSLNGEFIVFLEANDVLSPNALYEISKKLNENIMLKLIYTDEDKIDQNGNRAEPCFKSGWNPDMFFSQNYFGNLVCIEKKIVDRIGGCKNEYAESWDYDLFLKVITLVSNDEIGHIEKILYHKRLDRENKDREKTKHIEGLEALKNYFSYKNPQILIEDGLIRNTYKVNYPIPPIQPLVSLLIPTRDGYDILYKCIESIIHKTSYENYEIIILDNETTCPMTLEYFNEIQKNPKISVLKYSYPFNYSAINNFGMAHAKGEILGFINNDIEVINQGWLSQMVQHALREEIGAVGAKLYYANDTIQHAGVVIGLGRLAGHVFRYLPKEVNGYLDRLKVVQNYSAVTGACLIVRRAVFDEVGGFNEKDLAVAYNDVDLCLKIQKSGYRNIWTPYAELYHHESVSRGSDNTKAKKLRYSKEVEYMQRVWRTDIIKDRYYNPNLTLRDESFSLNPD